MSLRCWDFPGLHPIGLSLNVVVIDIATAMLNPSLTDTDFAASLNARIPAQRLGKPSDIAGAAVWLASSGESAYVNGVILPVDGGFTAK